MLFAGPFLIEIELLALRIASSQRGEDHLQDIEMLHIKFMRELKELEEADEQWDELPDVGYYTACMQIVAPNDAYAVDALRWLSQEIEIRSITPPQLEAGTLAKYRMRAIQPKDIEAERKAILAAIERAKETE